MAELTLTEARASLRKLIDWSDAIGRLRGVIDAAAELEEDVATYDRMKAALAEETKRAREEHDRLLADIAVKREAENRQLEEHRAQVAIAKADIDKQIASERAAATQLVQVFKEKASESMDNMRTELTSLQQELSQLRHTYKTVDEEVKAIKAEHQRILSRFSPA